MSDPTHSNASGATREARSSYRVVLEPSPKQIRVVFNGETLASSERALLVCETGHEPVYYFPRDDVRMELLERTHHRTRCPTNSKLKLNLTGCTDFHDCLYQYLGTYLSGNSR